MVLHDVSAALIPVHPSSPILSPPRVPWIETPWLMITHPYQWPSRKAQVMQLLKTPSPPNFLPFWNQHWAPSHPRVTVGGLVDMWQWWSKAKDRDCGGSASSADTCYNVALLHASYQTAGHTIYCVLLVCSVQTRSGNGGHKRIHWTLHRRWLLYW